MSGNTISSSVDTASQPIIQLPSKSTLLYLIVPSLILTLGSLNPADAGSDPELAPRGLHITNGKYIVVNDRWTSTRDRTPFRMWFYHEAGEMGNFLDVIIDVS